MTKHLSVLTLAIALAMATPVTVGAQESDAFARGVTAYEDGDYTTAAKIWTPLAEDGLPEAQRNLAQLYRLGLGVDRDNGRAYELYAAAAEQNSVEAQVNTAFLLLTGEGVEKDSKQAALWFVKAADQGDALAQFNLGLMYEKGVGVPQDRTIARELYQLSGNQGQERALARLEAIEEDLPPDGGAQARRDRAEAQEKEQAKAKAEAREDARQEAEVKRVKQRAQAKIDDEKASRMEKAKAEAKTGPILMIEKVEDTPRDSIPARDAGNTGESTAAIDAFENAEAAFRNAPTTAPTALRKPEIETRTTRNDATPSSQRLRQVREAEAAYGRGDFRTSARILMPLAQDGVPIAQFLLGRMFNRGEGVAINPFVAYSLWRSAMDNGSQHAATALANFSNRLAPADLERAEAFHRSRIRKKAPRTN